MKCKLSFTLAIFIQSTLLMSQAIVLDGYVYESNNRGYLNQVEIEITDMETGELVKQAYSDQDGHFRLEVAQSNVMLTANKGLFHTQTRQLSEASSVVEKTYFFKIELERKPGYLFEITLANKRDSFQQAVDAIHGAWIEVYNNTTARLEFSEENHDSPHFQHTLTKDNHYTLMMRKENYLAKRIEAFVNVKGCILCIEGISKLTPGVTDNLTLGHEMGTLLANIEMEPANVGSTFQIENLYYDLNKWKLITPMQIELRKVIQLMRDNPLLEVEIGSHTDARGSIKSNLTLSQKRANEVIEYLIVDGNIEAERLRARGFGSSELVNICAPGVSCTEEQHKANRRTELKVTGVRESSIKGKSIVEIKEMERIEEMIQNLQSEDVLEIKEGDELPDELKKQLEKQKENSDKN